jgi:uncharacterized cupin superfamily protein
MLLVINEATYSTARFKLATKYKWVAMWDCEEGDWRVVVDFEWSKYKIPVFGV